MSEMAGIEKPVLKPASDQFDRLGGSVLPAEQEFVTSGQAPADIVVEGYRPVDHISLAYPLRAGAAMHRLDSGGD